MDASRCRVARAFACLSRFMRLDSAPPGEWRDALGEWEALTWLHVFFDDAEQADMLRTALPDLHGFQVGGEWGMSIDDSLAPGVRACSCRALASATRHGRPMVSPGVRGRCVPPPLSPGFVISFLTS